MADQFEEGEVVQLKSGGPKMTVETKGDKYLCHYFHEGDIRWVELKPHSLKKASSTTVSVR